MTRQSPPIVPERGVPLTAETVVVPVEAEGVRDAVSWLERAFPKDAVGFSTSYRPTMTAVHTVLAALSAAPAREQEGGAVGDERQPDELELAIHELLWPYFESAKLGHFTHENDCSRAARQIAAALKPGFYLSRFLAAITSKEAPSATGAVEREAIARICDPKGWATRDSQYESIRRSTMHDKDRPLAFANADYYTRDSLTQADAILALRAQPQAREEAQPVAWLVEWRFKDQPGLVPGGGSDIVRNQYAAVESLLADLNRMPDMGWTKVTPLAPVSTTPPAQPLAEGADAEKLREALTWALAEIQGDTRYENESQREAALGRALAALQQEGGK